MTKYRVPIFFKSEKSLYDAGFVDNGRHKIELKSEQKINLD
jgi:hypothetical protein